MNNRMKKKKFKTNIIKSVKLLKSTVDDVIVLYYDECFLDELQYVFGTIKYMFEHNKCVALPSHVGLGTLDKQGLQRFRKEIDLLIKSMENE